MADTNKNYTLGRGKLFFAPFKTGTQEPDGFQYFGNTPELALTIEAENLDHFSSDEGIREKDDSVPLEVNRTGSFTTDSIKPETIAFFFFGEHSQVVVAGGNVASESIPDVHLGRSYQLGYDPETNLIGNKVITNLVVNGTAGVKATEDGTFSGTSTQDDTITIGTKVYRMRDTLAQANDVLIGEDAATSAFNLTQAINGGAGSGFLYHAATVAHTQVDATVAGAVVTVTAKVAGTAGNSIALAESSTQFSWAGGATNLSGGAAATGIAAADNYELDAASGILTLFSDAADIVELDDLTVSYDFGSGTREQILSGSEPVEGALIFVANNPKGHDFNYFMPYVKLSPNGDYNLKGDEWQTIPFNLEILKLGSNAAIYVDGAEFIR